MKSYNITFKVNSLIIPFSYHHQLQSLIYSILRAGGGEGLHDSTNVQGRGFKHFVFSTLSGSRVAEDKRHLLFQNEMKLNVRSVKESFCTAFEKGLMSGDEFKFFDTSITIDTVKVSKKPIDNDIIKVKMLSPVTVHITESNGFTRYLKPFDDDFSAELNKNFKRKYYALYGEYPDGDIKVTPLRISDRDEYITRYKRAKSPDEKDIYISGWRGLYQLEGKSEYLNFIYYCGLGANNSDGFGMIEELY